MYSRVVSAHIKGVVIDIINVECDISSGLPVMDMVGLLGSDVKEAKERVRTALKNSGIYIPPKRVTINMSPSNIRKQGNIYDLPIALAIIAAMGVVAREDIDNVLVMGELSLEGKVNKVNGVLPVIAEAKRMGVKKFIIPQENLCEGEIVEGVYIKGVSSILDVVETIKNNNYILTGKYAFEEESDNKEYIKDFYEVKGQESVKRAVMIAAAGLHNMLMIGAPGCGKSMIAERIPFVLPSPTMDECLEITKIQSISGEFNTKGLVTHRPFRSPHHTISKIALVGGGHTPKVGEITLAHNGVLFLDELTEFKNQVLDTLRQPLEEGRVLVNRAGGGYVFPSKVMLVTAANPCKCGYYPDRSKCNCSLTSVRKYMERISGPMLDRMDIWVFIPGVSIKEIDSGKCMSSAFMRERIEYARKVQKERYSGSDIMYNSRLSGKEIDKYCKIGKAEREFVNSLYENTTISYRGYHKIIKVARTIADIEGSEDILIAHLAEAAGYRNDFR